MKNKSIKHSHYIYDHCLVVIIFFFFCYTQYSFAQYGTLVDEVEAEDGILTGVTVSTLTSGYSGTGYITGFDNIGDKVTVTVNVTEAGFYKLVIRYLANLGEKTQDLYVNGEGPSLIVFPLTITFSDIDAGNYLLNEGANTITVQKNWGWSDVDKFTIYPALENTYNITPDLIDEDADSVTKALYDTLVSWFGEKIISGQTNSYFDIINDKTGRIPMIRAWDFQSYTEGYPYHWDGGGHTFGLEDNGSVQAAIDWYNNTAHKGLVTFHWHWHSPSGGSPGTNTFYTNETSFDVSQAVIPATQEYNDIIRDIDTIAYQLKRLQSTGIPVLWRPLHEAGGGWFWWGAKGQQACLKLYNILFDRLKNHHQLHNLIWVWSTPETDWYPGNDSVDIIGHDSYPGAYNYTTQKNAFDRLYNLVNGEKLIAMTENGPIPEPENCLTYDTPWLYFLSWADLVTQQNSDLHLWDVYNHYDVLSFEGDYVNRPTSIIEPEISNDYQLFPIPAKDVVHIEGEHITKMELIDIKGKIIFTANNPADEIDIHKYENGIYILKLYNVHKVSFYKLIINK